MGVPRKVNLVALDYEKHARLSLTEDEAFALLSMCLLTNMTLDEDAENALKKLAAFCKHEQYFTPLPDRKSHSED
ncbi:MAG: hypothetical protein H0W86_12305 [Armatimonadetes bacterium]|nr:hypothetical protein [Armatimonadota bacterium]